MLDSTVVAGFSEASPDRVLTVVALLCAEGTTSRIWNGSPTVDRRSSLVNAGAELAILGVHATVPISPLMHVALGTWDVDVGHPQEICCAVLGAVR